MTETRKTQLFEVAEYIPQDLQPGDQIRIEGHRFGSGTFVGTVKTAQNYGSLTAPDWYIEFDTGLYYKQSLDGGTVLVTARNLLALVDHSTACQYAQQLANQLGRQALVVWRPDKGPQLYQAMGRKEYYQASRDNQSRYPYGQVCKPATQDR